MVDVRGTGPSIRLLHSNLPEIRQHGVEVGGARVLGGYVWKGRLREGGLEGRAFLPYYLFFSDTDGISVVRPTYLVRVPARI